MKTDLKDVVLDPTTKTTAHERFKNKEEHKDKIEMLEFH